MFAGEYLCKVDEKGRFIVPSPIREQIESEGQAVVFLKGPEESTLIYSMKEWEKVLERTKTTLDEDQSRLFMHFVVSEAGTSEIDKAGRIVHHGHISITKGVNRLFAIADKKNRRLERGTFRHTDALPPRPDQQRHKLPLHAARVLKFVDEYVVVARLEPVPAARELLHLREQGDGACQRFGKVEDAVRFQRLVVLLEGDAIHAPDASREHGV
jgi:division/cell wall cluster transcriptional repressor MraZ